MGSMVINTVEAEGEKSKFVTELFGKQSRKICLQTNYHPWTNVNKLSQSGVFAAERKWEKKVREKEELWLAEESQFESEQKKSFLWTLVKLKGFMGKGWHLRWKFVQSVWQVLL